MHKLAVLAIGLAFVFADAAWSQTGRSSPPGRGTAPSRGANASRGAARGGAATAADDALLKTITEAVQSGKLGGLLPTIDEQLKTELGAAKTAQPAHFVRLVALREFTRYFGKMSKASAEDTATLQWVLSKPQLLDVLMMAVSQSDSPEKVLDVVSQLSEAQVNNIDRFADLAAAICVVWDQPGEQAHGNLGPARKVRPGLSRQPALLMRYYAMIGAQMPWELATYLVDNLASEDDIAWAAQRYRGRGAIGAVFFDVPYDREAFAGTSRLRLEDDQYTLQNIVRVGGLCGDQAYFAAQVARSVGIPATIATGRGATDGTGHAWVGYLAMRGNRALWNFEEGRYPENQYWRGDVMDPQTRQMITDADVSLSAELLATQPQDRLVSMALIKTAEMLPPEKQPAAYMQAIDLSPGNRRAWMALADMGAKKKLSPQETADLNSAISRFAAQPYPDFAFTVLGRAQEGHPPAEQIKAYDAMRGMFRLRPDILAAISLAQGDVYRHAKQPDAALAAYGDVLTNYLNIGPIVANAMEHVDQMLMQSRSLDQLAKIYDSVWSHLPQPKTSISVQGTPFYKIGVRYEQLLIVLGDRTTAQTVRTRLDSLTATNTSGRR